MLTQQQLADKIKCSLRTVTRMDEQTREAWALLAEQGKVHGYQDLIAALVFEHDVFNLKYGSESSCSVTFFASGSFTARVYGAAEDNAVFRSNDPYAALAYLKEQNYAK